MLFVKHIYRIAKKSVHLVRFSKFLYYKIVVNDDVGFLHVPYDLLSYCTYAVSYRVKDLRKPPVLGREATKR